MKWLYLIPVILLTDFLLLYLNGVGIVAVEIVGIFFVAQYIALQWIIVVWIIRTIFTWIRRQLS